MRHGANSDIRADGIVMFLSAISRVCSAMWNVTSRIVAYGGALRFNGLGITQRAALKRLLTSSLPKILVR